MYPHLHPRFSSSTRFHPLLSEASCRSAIDAARNFVEDVGVSSAARSVGLTELAKCTDKNSERDCKTVIVNKYHLSLPVQKTYLETEDTSVKIPVLSMRSWGEFLLRSNCWHVLTGLTRPDEEREKAILSCFWSKFKEQNPSHDVFKLADSGELSLDATAPVVVHGDEGRGRKHQAYLVVSFRGVLGRGLNPGEKEKTHQKVKKPYLKQLCNYRGHSYTSRFMIAGLRKADYAGSKSHVFSSLMSSLASQALSVSTDGFWDAGGNRKWLMMIYITGDWPWLHKSGCFLRSFNNAQKKKGQTKFVGICHECRAGQDSIPFEQIGTKRPLWLSTEYTQDPFNSPSPFAAVPHDPGKLPSLWVWDFFHTWHLGVAKRFLGGALALLSMQESGANIDDRFCQLSERYQIFCRANGHRAHIQKLTKETIAWATTGTYPCAIWHKGELTTVFMAFMESEVNKRNFPDEPLLELVKQGVVAINTSIRAMYKADLWPTRDQLFEISGHGLRFLRRYEELAGQSHVRGMPLFQHLPKIHCLHKIYLRLHFAAVRSASCLNPLAVSVQQCEDFISRPSRLSRRVAGGDGAPEKVMDRYLIACYPQWIQAGYIIRPL